MTLISNFITKDFIILAGDRRLCDFNSRNQPILDKFADDTIKLFPGKNYCIGMQGTFESHKNDYKGDVEKFVHEHPNLSKAQLLDLIPLIVNEVAQSDEHVDEINLTISGFDEGGLFSYHYSVKDKHLVDCYEHDSSGYRFNDDNDPSSQFYRQSKIYLASGLNQVNPSRYSSHHFKLPPISKILPNDLAEAIVIMYKKFSDNNFNYLTIGGPVDYCIIERDRLEMRYSAMPDL